MKPLVLEQAPLPEPVRLWRPDGTCAVVNPLGAAISSFTIEGAEVLVSRPRGAEDGQVDTTHSTLPFSVNWGGPKHGMSRNTLYATVGQTYDHVAMEAVDLPTGLVHRQALTLRLGGISCVDIVTNFNEPVTQDAELTDHDSFATSFGKHPYYASDIEHFDARSSQGDGQLTVVRENGEHVTGTWKDLAEYLQRGETLICNQVNGSLILTLEEQKLELELSVDATIGKHNPGYHDDASKREVPVAVAFWSRGNGTVCVEQLVGVARDERGRLHNDLLHLGPQEYLLFTTHLYRRESEATR